MNIWICDDCREDAEYLQELLEQYLEAHGTKMQLKIFRQGRELLEWEEKPDFDWLFLDIFMKEMDGLSTARELRKRGGKGKIFLISSSPEFGPQSYEIAASWYLVKPIGYEDLSKALEQCTEWNEAKELRLTADGVETVIPISRIDYIETEGRKTVIHMGKRTVRVYKPLEQLYQELKEENFLRPHRSYILNMAFIERLDGAQFRLLNGETVTLNRSNRKKIREIYHNYLFRTLDMPGNFGEERKK